MNLKGVPAAGQPRRLELSRRHVRWAGLRIRSSVVGAAVLVTLSGASVAVPYLKQSAVIRDQFADDVDAIAWTPELRPLADAVATAYRDVARLDVVLPKAKTVQSIEAKLDGWQAALAEVTTAARALRFALGLATVPR